MARKSTSKLLKLRKSALTIGVVTSATTNRHEKSRLKVQFVGRPLSQTFHARPRKHAHKSEPVFTREIVLATRSVANRRLVVGWQLLAAISDWPVCFPTRSYTAAGTSSRRRRTSSDTSTGHHRRGAGNHGGRATNTSVANGAKSLF